MLGNMMMSAWKDDIDELHAPFRQRVYANLSEAICLCDFDPAKASSVGHGTRKAIWSHLVSGGADFKQFGLYSMPYCKVMGTRAKAVRNYIARKGPNALMDPDISVATLQDVADEFALCRDTTVFPIKSFVLSRGLEDQYDGLLPNTSPCRAATWMLVGDEYGSDPRGHADFCRKLARETGVNITHANSFLYLIGMELP